MDTRDEHTRDQELIVSETHAERRRMAQLLSSLTPEQWGAASLCEGWAVRDVVAHTTMPFRYSTGRFVLGMIRAGGRFNAFADRAARKDAAELGDARLLRALEDNIEHPWRPPGGGRLGALAHDVIHGVDITEALGLPGPPAARIALAVGRPAKRQLRYFGVDLDGIRLVATDGDLRIGDGPREVPLTSKEILLVVTGRRPLRHVAARR